MYIKRINLYFITTNSFYIMKNNERFKSFHFIKSSVQLSSFFLLNCVDRFEARNNPAVSLYFGL
jgi:hypothetical protein